MNCTSCVKLIWADGIIVLLYIIDYYSIILKVNLKLRGFTEFTKRTLPLHIYSINTPHFKQIYILHIQYTTPHLNQVYILYKIYMIWRGNLILMYTELKFFKIILVERRHLYVVLQKITVYKPYFKQINIFSIVTYAASILNHI